MHSGLQSLLLCSDDKVVRVLRRVLSELEIGVEHCEDADTAVRKLTRQRFEAVIVDCTTPEIALRILKGTHSAPANKRAITVAILEGQTTDGQSALKGAFALGAHFVLFKPISLEKTKSSFRAVRALMKRERRRNVRLPIELPVELQVEGRSEKINAVIADLGENGMALKTPNFKLPPAFRVRFTLPGNHAPILGRGEVAWEGKNMHGVRFRDLSVEHCDNLKLWISRQVAAIEGEEPAVNCKLTDLSLNACYLQTESPFPVRTRLQLMMKVRKLEVHVEGIVRVMHPGAGMGVEFNQHTSEQRTRVEEFIQTLVNTAGAVPDIQVRPDTIDQNAAESSSQQATGDQGDPLLFLFRIKAELSPEAFQAELAKQRGVPAEVGV
jgi:DNA-binding response OmpR family regulator